MSLTEAVDLPRYDITRSYQWNYDHPPDPVEIDVPPIPGDWTFCGRPAASPLGMPAGPLLNGQWVLYYASLGFDVLTYKTTRSGRRECYPLPNLLPVETGPVQGTETDLPAISDMRGSWAVSFGMPSADPPTWQQDVEWTRPQLPAHQTLVVSVVGTVQPGWSLDQLADDYAQCARWAVDSGADCIETNFSCPNVSTCDGQLYQQPEAAAVVAHRVREAIGPVPYLIKIGHTRDAADAEQLIDAVAPFATALAMTNSVATTIRQPDGSLCFDGQKRGICGDAVLHASIRQTRMFADIIARRQFPLRVVGVGGVSTAAHVREYLEAGAESIQIATAAMVDPLVGVRIRREWNQSSHAG